MSPSSGVSDLAFLSHIKSDSEFVPGNTKNCVLAWENILSDKVVIDLIKGISLEFIDDPPVQRFVPPQYKFDPFYVDVIDSEFQKLIDRNFVPEIHWGSRFITNVFIGPKPNNKFRLIIDLSPLNVYIRKDHFMRDNFVVAVGLMFLGAYVASIDLKDVY